MLTAIRLVTAALMGLRSAPPLPAGDTLRLRVGSPEIDASGLRPHFARVTVERLVDGVWRKVSEWTNRLELGDSAGRHVHRWTTIGTTTRPTGETLTWKLFQTFDNQSLAQLGLKRTLSDGSQLQLAFDGPKIRGTKTVGAGGTTSPVDVNLSEAPFPLAATDLVPSGVKLRPGLVMTIPAWQYGLPDVETHIFTVVGRKEIPIAGKPWQTWAVEERSVGAGVTTFVGTWYLADQPPYMVYAEVAGPNGTKQRMTEVLVDGAR